MASGEFLIEDDRDDEDDRPICIDLTDDEDDRPICIDLTEDDDSSKNNSKPGKQESKPEKQKSKSLSLNVIDHMFDRQLGQLQPLTFENAQFKPKRFFCTANKELHIGSCEYINTGLDGESVVGLWKGDEYPGILYKLKMNLNSKRITRDADAPANTIVDIEKFGPYFIKTRIADMCDTYIGNENAMLYVGNRDFDDQGGMNNSVAVNFPFSDTLNNRLFLLDNENPTCCSGCRHDNKFGVGTDEGITIYKNQKVLYVGREKVTAMELSREGHLVYCGCPSNQLVMYDMRRQPTACHKIPIDGLSSTGISSLKLVSDQNLLIARSFDGIMTKIDMRLNSVITKYVNPDPCSDGRKIPFSVNESADLVCATGSDNITRLWSYTSGKLLHNFDPVMPSTKTHSALFVSGVRWGVAMFQKDKMYVIEPWR